MNNLETFLFFLGVISNAGSIKSILLIEFWIITVIFNHISINIFIACGIITNIPLKLIPKDSPMGTISRISNVLMATLRQSLFYIRIK